MTGVPLDVLFTRLGLVLATGTVLVATSLLAYLFVYNFRDPVARAFVLLLGFADFVYVGDVFLSTAQLPASHPAAAFWLRFEWVGIAFVVPALLHFGDSLLLATGHRSAARRNGLIAAYVAGAVVLFAVLGSSALVGPVVGQRGSVYLERGPLFPLFAVLFLVGTAMACSWVWRARQRTLTARSRRRTTLLLVAIAAPLSVFPYLAADGHQLSNHHLLFLALTSAASAVTAAMLLVVAYAVAYHGALTPDRAVRRDLLKYLVQVPALGMLVIATLQLLPSRLQGSLGLPRDVVFALIVVVGIVVYQLLLRALRPVIDHLLYGRQRDELEWLRRLDERLLTAEDLAQLLDNILASLCDRLRIRDGLIVIMSGNDLRVGAMVGNRQRALALIELLGGPPLVELCRQAGVVQLDGFWVQALRAVPTEAPLGILGIDTPDHPLSDDEQQAYRALVSSAARALDDRLVQQRMIGLLRDIEPEMTGIQRLRGALEQAPDAASKPEASPVLDPDFRNWVKDALHHYWGGPKLIDTPLMRLQVVAEALERHDHNTAKAMRAVLDEALEQMKPDGERSMTASRWLIYNILELRFVRGLHVRDIAARLAMSESDLYRKQRLAIEALAQQLAAMEAAPERPAARLTGEAGRAPEGRRAVASRRGLRD